MRKITLLVLFLSTLWGYSQVKGYTFSQSTGTYSDITGTVLGTNVSDQQYFVNAAVPSGSSSTVTGVGIPIGFDFVFNGYVYNRFGVNTNGWIALGSSLITPNAINMDVSSNWNPLANTKAITPEALSARIAPLGADLKAQTNSSIQFLSSGEAPNRTLVIQWKNYRHYDNLTGDSFNFQIRFTETANTVEFIYGGFTTAATKTYMVGLRVENAGTNFVNRSATASWDDTAAGTAVANTVTMTSVVKPSNGLTFKWTPGTCSEPKNLTTSNITTSGVSLGWDSYLPAPAGYEYVLSTLATVPAEAGTKVSSSSATIADLTPGTKYNVFVRSTCGAESSQWVNIGNFKTRCLDVPAYTENFDAYSAGKIPDCWFIAGNGATLIDVGGASTGTAPNRLKMDATSVATAPTVAYAILPPVTNLNIGTYRLKFKANASAANRSFEVGYLTNINDPATFTFLQKIDLTTASQEFAVYPPVTIPEGVKYLVFKNAGAGTTVGQTLMYVDDVIWQPIPACTDVKKVVASLPTATSVKLSWLVTGTETAWQYALSPTTVTDPSALPAESIMNIDLTSVAVGDAILAPNARSLTVNNLTADTSYKIWVRSKCAEGAYGYWAPSQSFLMPACSTVATITESFDANLTVPDCWRKIETGGTISVVANQGSGTSNGLELKAPGANLAVFTAFPPLSTAMTGGYRIKFKSKSVTAGSKLDIICYTDPLYSANTNTVYTILKTVTFSTANTEYVTSEVFAPTATAYLGFRYYHTGNAATAYIDDFVWEALPACPDVTAVSIAEITAESLGLSWTTTKTENDWQYALGTSITNNPDALTAIDFPAPFVNVANVTASIGNLIPSTAYKVWIRSKCNESTLGSWIGPIYFKTNCQGAETFTENFDASLDYPSCWNKVGSANALVAAQGGSNVLKIEGNTTSTATKGIVTMKPLSNSANGTHILRFKLSGSAVGAKVEVGYIINPQDPSKFITLNKFFTVASTTVFSSESVELGFEPASQVLAFRNPGTSTTTNSVYIDDVVWEPLPTCSDVSKPTPTGITSTTVGLTWTKGGTEGSWQYAIGESTVTDPGTLTAVNIVSPTIDDLDISTVITGLTPTTSYKVWVRSKCSGTAFGVWKGPYDFATTCAPVDKFVQKFDVNTDIPACWNKVGTLGTVAVVAMAGGSPPNALKLESSATAKAIVAMPPVNNAGAGTHRLRFRFRSSVANGNIHIGYLTNIADPASFKLVEAIVAPAANVYYSKIVNLGTNPTTELLAFKNPDASLVHIDDVNWEPLPTCLDLSALAVVKATSNQVDLGWTAGGSETAWQYALGTATDVDPDLLTAVDFVAPVPTGSSIVGGINNLTVSTSYKVWVRAKCSDTSFGIWTEPVAFATSCPTVESITEKFDVNTNMPTCWSKVGALGTVNIAAVAGTPSGGNALYLYTSTTANKPVVALPAVSNVAAGTHRLKFKFKCNYVGQVLEVGYLKTVSDANTFVALKSFTSTTNAAYENAVAELGTLPGSEVLAFRNAMTGSNAISFYVDNVTWAPIPACPDMTTVTKGTITSTTANVKWTVGGTETAWQYALGTATDVDPSLLTAVDFISPEITGTNVSADLNGLTSSTSYKIWVRANCGLGSFGAWTEVALPFTTSCATMTAFTENFDTTASVADPGVLPSCWTKVGTVGIGKVSVYAGAPSGPNLMVINSSSETTRAVVAMPAVSNAAAGTHRLRFKARGSKDSVPFEVGYVTDITKPDTFFPLKSFTTGLATEYNTNIAVLGTDPTSQYLAFRNSGLIAGGSSIYIDDVIWEPIPTCADVTALTANTTTNSATIAWTAGDAETAWQYVKGEPTVIDPTTLTAVDVDSKTLTLTDLPSATSFKVWVRSKCEATVTGAWIGPITFKTTCAPVTEFVQKFDVDTTIPSCWSQIGNQGTVAIGTNTINPSAPNHLALISPTAIVRAVVAMQPVSNAGAGTHRLRFKSRGLAANTAFEVGYLTNIADPLSFVKVEDLKAVSTTVFGDHIVFLGNKPTSQVLAFRNPGNGTTSTSVFIDDVVWELQVPVTCATGITATPDANCGNYATVISWPAMDSASGYKLTVGTTAGGSEVINNEDLGNVLSYSVTGTANTTYYYTLKPYNGLGEATGCVEQTFVTNANNCYCASVPTTNEGAGITKVQFGGVKFENPDVTYNDFTAKQVNLAQGVNTVMDLSFNTGVFAFNTNIWIDFNDNKLFEALEIVWTGKSSNVSPNVLGASFVLQPTATLGVHRMRIGSAVSGQNVANPCYSGTLGVTLDFKVNIVAPVSNDEPAQAVALTVGPDFTSNAVVTTNVDATASLIQEPACGNYSGSDVWYKATVPVTGNVTFEVNSVSAGIINTAAAAYSGTLEALTLIGCDDSSSVTGKNIEGDQPKIVLTGRTVGEVIYFRVWENGGDAFGTYKVSAYDPALGGIMGVDNFDISSLSFYPNPVKDMLNISLDKEITDVTVINLLGQQVIAKSVNSNQVKVDMSGLTIGTYLVRITADNQTKTIKVVKQ